MTIGFFRPVGSVADVNELEYISAITQTDTHQVRSNGSITAEDIRFFLLSRYGIDVSEQEVASQIIRGLGGGDEEEDDTIDLMEIVATLLIPTLRKATATVDLPTDCVAPRENLIPFVLDMILHDVCGTTDSPELSMGLIQKILTMYGEPELAENVELLREMLEASQTNNAGTALDANAFISGLTSDIELYDPLFEIRPMTNPEDVILNNNKLDEGNEEKLIINDEEQSQKKTENTTSRTPLNRKKTMFAALDVTAGTYRSKMLLVGLWLVFIIVYFGFIHPTMDSDDECPTIPYGTTWSTSTEYVVCGLIAKFIMWLCIFFISSIWGCLLIGTGSIGNTNKVRSFLIPLLGMTCLAFFLFVPDQILLAVGVDDTPLDFGAKEEYLGTIMYILFGIIAIIHVRYGLSLLAGASERWKKSRLLNYQSESVQFNSAIQKAGAYKMNTMVENAMKLALEKQQESVIATHFGQGLLNFSRKENQLEWTCNFFETVRNIWSGKMIEQEGIWISARIQGSNIGQFIVIAFVFIAGYSLSQQVLENYTIEDAKAATSAYVGILFNQQVSDEQVQSLLLNTSASLTGFLATTASSDVFQQHCQQLPTTTSLFDLATSSCSFSSDSVPSCSNLTSREDYLCSLAQTYQDAGVLSSSGGSGSGSGGCCSWGDGICGEEESCNESQEICEKYCAGIFLQDTSNDAVSDSAETEPFTDEIGGCCSWGGGLCGNESPWCDESRTNCEGTCSGTYIRLVETIYKDRASELFQTAIGGTEEALVNVGLLEASGLDLESLLAVARTNLQTAAESSVDSLYPAEEYMVYVPFLVGTIVASVTALSLAITYIPSVTSTTLKLRSGVIPSLRDPEFHNYRKAADQVTMITGSLFWGSLIASTLMGALVGFSIFLFLWQASVPIIIQGLTFVTGILAVILIKLSFVGCCRCAFYKGFYRRRLAAVNMTNLVLECATFAISAGFVVVRMIKLLLTAALYVGRIDTFFLAPGVGRAGNVELDNYPRIFLKEILSHEAHRHPYIDLLGVIYLMKLRHGDEFGNRAGATWRLIFVYALMPWLHKYRIHDVLEEQQKTFLTKKKKTEDKKSVEADMEQSRTTNSLILRETHSISNDANSQILALKAENADLKARIARLEAASRHGDDDVEMSV